MTIEAKVLDKCAACGKLVGCPRTHMKIQITIVNDDIQNEQYINRPALLAAMLMEGLSNILGKPEAIIDDIIMRDENNKPCGSCKITIN